MPRFKNKAAAQRAVDAADVAYKAAADAFYAHHMGAWSTERIAAARAWGAAQRAGDDIYDRGVREGYAVRSFYFGRPTTSASVRVIMEMLDEREARLERGIEARLAPCNMNIDNPRPWHAYVHGTMLRTSGGVGRRFKTEGAALAAAHKHLQET